MKNLFTIAAGLAVIAATTTDVAADGHRKNGLSGDKAVRHRRLLVKHRIEVAPLFESTINADYRHIVGGGAKLEYHLGDMLSIGGIAVGSTAINTAITDRIIDTLETNNDPTTPEPSVDEFTRRLNSIPFHGAGYLSITPWYGKLAAFSQAFVAFDFYFQGGVAFAQLTSNCALSAAGPCDDDHPGTTKMQGADTIPADLNPNNDDPLNAGQRIGLYLGGGIHVFMSDFIALDLTVRDYAFADNPSGADVSGPQKGPDRAVTKDDNRFLHHLFFGAGVSVLFPIKVKRTP